MIDLKTVAAIACVLVSPIVALAQAPQRPNVLFIAVDDLRPELGCYGSAIVKSPNIDRIAARGVVFNRAYVQQAVCSPSRSSLLTGTRPDTTKVWDLETHFRVALPDVVTLPQHFKNNGYFVRGLGKIYHGGFDDPQSWSVPWEIGKAPTYALPENLAIVQGKRKAAQAEGKTGKAVQRASRGPAVESADVPDDIFTDGRTANLAIGALQEISQKSEPFFLAVGFDRPHLPSVGPQEILGPIRPEQDRTRVQPVPPDRRAAVLDPAGG
jgi:iduronate 2-sulfatase